MNGVRLTAIEWFVAALPVIFFLSDSIYHTIKNRRRPVADVVPIRNEHQHGDAA